MKVLLLSVVFVLLAATANADSYRCRCVGNQTSKDCGAGGIGGNFLKVKTGIKEEILHYYIGNSNASKLINTGHEQYSSQTGWVCNKQ